MSEAVKAIVLFANPFKFDDEQGKQHEGITVEYVMTDSMKPQHNEDGSSGFRTAKESIGIGMFQQIKVVPALYELMFGYTVIKNKPAMKLKELKFLAELK